MVTDRHFLDSDQKKGILFVYFIFKWDKQASKERKALKEEMLLTKEHHKKMGRTNKGEISG